MFLTRREPGVPLSLFRPYPLPFSHPFLLYFFLTIPFLLSFSLIYICCSFRGGILSVVFPAVPYVSDPQGTWSALVSFPILSSSLFSSFSSILLLTLPFLLCFFIDLYLLEFPGRHSICCFRHCSQMFLTRREPGVPLSLFRPYPLPFSRPFLLYCSLPFLFFYVFFIDLYLLLFPGRHSICCFPHCSHMFLTRREPGVPLSLFRSYLFPFLLLFFYIVPYPSFSSMSFSLIYICCSFRGGILSVVFPAVAICFWPAWNLECPCLFSDLILFPFLLLFFYIVPYPSFSSMFSSLTYICCCFRGGILSADYLLFSPL